MRGYSAFKPAMPDSSTILLVDDEEAVQKLLAFPLERDGYLEIRRLGISETGDSGRFDSGDSDSYYALTPRGAEAIGIDPRLLD